MAPITKPLLRIVDNGPPSLSVGTVGKGCPSQCRQHDRRDIPITTQQYRRGIDELPDLDAFVATFGEWVEACWFAEHDRAPARLEALLAFPPDVVLVGALWILARLLERSDPRGLAPGLGDVADVAGALAEHLLITGPDPTREALIRAVVVGAGATPAARRELLQAYGSEAVTGAALECSSVLTQALANRWGVVPSNILEDL
jgi:hypothetical protein